MNHNSLINTSENKFIFKLPFTIDLKRLNTYSFTKLQEYVIKYNNFTNILQNEYNILQEENEGILHHMEDLQFQNKDICDVNIYLNNFIMLNDIKKSCKENLKKSLGEFFREIELSEFLFDKNIYKKFGFLLESYEQKINYSFLEINNFFGENEEKIKEMFENKKSSLENIKTVMDKVSKEVVGISDNIKNQMDYINKMGDKLIDEFCSVIKNIFEEKDKDKYFFEDFEVISKKSFENFSKKINLLKNQKYIIESEKKSLKKKLNDQEKEISILKNKNQSLYLRCDRLNNNLNTYKDLLTIEENDNKEDQIKLLKRLQIENKELSMSLQDIRTKMFEKETKIFKLKNQNQDLTLKIKDLVTSNIIFNEEKKNFEQFSKKNEFDKKKYEKIEKLNNELKIKNEEIFSKYLKLKNTKFENIDIENINTTKETNKTFSKNFSYIKIKEEKELLNMQNQNLKSKIVQIENNLKNEKKIKNEFIILLEKKELMIKDLKKV